jgi:TonB-linked SusC/RagA family outer membrane protein
METSFLLDYDLHKILKGLTVDGKFSYDAGWGNWRGMQWRPYIYSFNPADGTYTQGLGSVMPATGYGRTSATYNKYGEIALRYKNTFKGKHNLSAFVLASYNSESEPNSLTEYSYVPHVYQALIGRVNYDYRNKYLFELNAGYNGSNRFAAGHRYQLFPAASLGWVVTNEPFLNKSTLLNHFKLRGSFGQVGKDKLGSFSYYYKSTYVDGANYSFGVNSIANITGLIEGRMANESITWETATKYNVGIDSRWFDSRLSFNADVFKEHRTDILTNPGRYMITSGINGVAPANIGIVDNKGYELELGWNSKVRNGFSWFTKVIFADAKNKVIQLSEATKPYDYMYSTGNPIGQPIGYKFAGFFQSYQEIASSPQQFGLSNLAPGDIKYKDLNNDGVINQNDVCPIGHSPVPEITYSLQLGCFIKNLDFSIMFQGAALSSVYMVSDLGWDNSWGNYYENNINRWTPETAATANYPHFLQKADAGNQNYYLSDFWLKDGDYLRLKNIQIGYTLPKFLLRKTPVQSVRFYANAFNLITWDKVKKVDPESNPDRNNGYFYPQQKIINMGLNVDF